MLRFWQRVLVVTMVMVAAAGTAANAQPPVARPQPPPPVPGAKTPAAQPKPAPPAQPPATASKPVPPAQPPATASKPVPPAPAPTTASKPAPPAQTPGAANAAQPATMSAPAGPDTAPTESILNAPVFPSAQFLTSYDADLGQRFYIYGSTRPFAEVVAYYRAKLKDKGELVFDAPATHMFEVGKFKETEVAFSPGVTITDYAWQGSPGYLNPKQGGSPAYFPTVIQIVPPPPALAGRPR
jgi:hypothetical protein